MANQEHLDILKQGVDVWRKWREHHSEITPDLTGANLLGSNLTEFNFRGTNLSGANLRLAILCGADLNKANLEETNFLGANLEETNLKDAHLDGIHLEEAHLNNIDLNRTNLSRANLRNARFRNANLSRACLVGVNLRGADLRGANLKGANLWGADLSGALLSHVDLCNAFLQDADLSKAQIQEANLSKAHLDRVHLNGANLTRAQLTGADLNGANLNRANLNGAQINDANLARAILVRTNLVDANIMDCTIYGISVWDVRTERAKQSDLIITLPTQPKISVDNLKVAQFIHLLLTNKEIREVIDTVAKKTVLILGRFTSERKAVLDSLRDTLRTHGYVPILFDFDKPTSRDLTETVSTLAHLARFIIVDLTDPSSAPHEVATVIPHTVVPVQPLLLRELLVVNGKEVERRAYSMFKDLQRRYHWVLPTYTYTDQAHLLATLQVHVIVPAEQKAQELEKW